MSGPTGSHPILPEWISELGEYAYHTTFDIYLKDIRKAGALDPKLAALQDTTMPFFDGKRAIWFTLINGLASAKQMKELNADPPKGTTRCVMLKIPISSFRGLEIDIDREDVTIQEALEESFGRGNIEPSKAPMDKKLFQRLLALRGFFVCFDRVELKFPDCEVPWISEP